MVHHNNSIRPYIMKTLALLIVPAVAAVSILSASAQPAAMSPADMAMHQSDAGDGPATKAFKAANDKMMQGMGAHYTGKADPDFVSGMISHHQGAIDMAKVELQYGTDPELKRLAKNIISAQEKEIAFMQSWQRKHGQK